MTKRKKLSARPDCPMCGETALTGKLWMKSRGWFTKCQNDNCKAGVYLNDDFDVEKAVRHYHKGKLI